MSAPIALDQLVPQLTIIGTGLLGGSLALGLRAAGYRGKIVGVGHRKGTLKRAEALGCMDVTTMDLMPTLAQSQLVILATPLGVFEQLLTQIALHDHPQLTITDVGSTKARVCQLAQSILPDATRFVGSHPMAGSEHAGPEFAIEDLFAAKPCIVTPLAKTGAKALRTAKTLWTTLGMKLIEMSPAEHDKQTALVSHLPHLLAAVLVKVVFAGEAEQVASTGFGDVTRLASGNPRIWRDIFASNREAVIESIDALTEQLGAFKNQLLSEQDQDIYQMLENSQINRNNWGKAHGRDGSC